MKVQSRSINKILGLCGNYSHAKNIIAILEKSGRLMEGQICYNIHQLSGQRRPQ
jgi:hypothetical protein